MHLHAVVARQDILEAMTGIALVIDRELRVVAGGWRNWRAFWRANGGVGPAPAMCGQDLTLGFSAGAVRSGFRAALTALSAGERGPLRLPFRCDAPGLQRDMLLSVTRCGTAHMLYHAMPLTEKPRPVPLTNTGSAPQCCAVCGRAAPGQPDPLDWTEPSVTTICLPTHEVCPRCTLLLMAQPA